MNDFDKFLDAKLRQMLDPVVATPAPPRGRAKGTRRPVLAVEIPLEAIPALEPAVVTVPVVAAPQL